MPGPAASSVKPGNTVSITNTATQVGQTTWQKLSNRIKALERNVTLSTGFLEELSLKYIKQIEELIPISYDIRTNNRKYGMGGGKFSDFKTHNSRKYNGKVNGCRSPL